MNLNAAQQAAVTHESGPLLIVAGAGTGKTTVVSERIRYLIEKQHVDPYHIFAATFTEKAAEEMRTRLDAVMPFGYQEPWLGTFHGLCERLLQKEGLEIGLNPSYKIMTQTDTWIFIRQHLYEFDLQYYRPLGNPTRFIGALIKFFSRLTDENISIEEFISYADSLSELENEDEAFNRDRILELAHAYQKYHQLKIEHSVLDFGDLIAWSVKLLKTRPNIRAKYQQQFKHILVDEFQDTNYAQFELVKLLAPPEKHPNLIVVGDDDQSIYKFRGASVSNILEYKTEYPEAKEIVLFDNYRSTQEILNSAYNSIVQNNPDRLEVKLNINKHLAAHRQSEQEPAVYKFQTAEDEVNWTVAEIVKLITEKELTHKDIAIITRSNSQLEPYVIALKAAGLPYQLVANRGLFDQDEIKDLLLFLQVLADPDNSMVLFQLSQCHVFQIDPTVMLAALQEAKKVSISLWAYLGLQSDSKFQKLVTTIDKYRHMVGDKNISQLLYDFVESTRYIQPFVAKETIENQLKIKNLNLFFNQLKRFEVNSDDKSIIGFLNTLELWLEAGENPGQAQIEDIDTITLMTIHASKGLEYDAVFVAGLVAGKFPSNNRKDPIEVPEPLIKEKLPQGDEHLQEERRLFYVALTRARRFLYLTFAEDLGGARKRKMSGFCQETGLEVRQINIPAESLTPKKNGQARPVYLLENNSYAIDTVSFTQIDTYQMCPLKYKFRYLLQIPSKPHHSLSFGRTIHQTLYDFHRYELQGKSLELPELLDMYKANFIEAGYQDAQHKKERYQAGLVAMERYYQLAPALFGRPLLLEQSFQLKLNGATVIGKIDRIDVMPTGEYEIIDYKTGSLKDQKTVDKDEQLTIYALAAKEALKLAVSQMSLYFIEGEGHKVSTKRENGEIEKAKLKLEKRIKEIQESDFQPKPDAVKCGFCEYQPLCPFASNKQR